MYWAPSMRKDASTNAQGRLLLFDNTPLENFSTVFADSKLPRVRHEKFHFGQAESLFHYNSVRTTVFCHRKG